ncbi:MAG: bifunctional (p)ppGpp synthetase/guanosine-3',5'-bis(diphosphate) 3'-pyrophosphohydrolase [Pirellulales bacterium]|nr:bifunctional (p)ppGpp synthetase/guanosine-3',5'-bis(diphosphate) 3'-pyrophosphohydrolase [Pirellulales bacterium]
MATESRLSSRFESALVYAAQLHAAQTRKASDVPYVAHLLAVASLVIEHGGDEDEVIAALLHDAIEDQGGAPTRAAIVERFGPRVAEIVAGCTDAEVMPKPPWRARKEAHLAHVAVASDSIRLVIAADKLHNARALLHDYRLHGELLWERFNGGREGTLWYYRSMVDALRRGWSHALVDQLARELDELERLANID